MKTIILITLSVIISCGKQNKPNDILKEPTPIRPQNPVTSPIVPGLTQAEQVSNLLNSNITISTPIGSVIASDQVETILNDFFEDSILYNTTFVSTNFKVIFSLEISNSTNSVMGSCLHGSEPNILLNPYTWLNLSEISKKNLVYHELGHCLLNKDHDNSVISCPAPIGLIYRSIMKTNLVSDDEFLVNKSYYLNELFGDGGCI